jgi:hypothetical protein
LRLRRRADEARAVVDGLVLGADPRGAGEGEGHHHGVTGKRFLELGVGKIRHLQLLRKSEHDDAQVTHDIAAALRTVPADAVRICGERFVTGFTR